MQFQSSCSAMYGDVSDRVGCRNSIEARAISRVQNHKPRRLNMLLGLWRRVHGGWSQMEPWEAKFCLVVAAKYGRDSDVPHAEKSDFNKIDDPIDLALPRISMRSA